MNLSSSSLLSDSVGSISQHLGVSAVAAGDPDVDVCETRKGIDTHVEMGH